MRPLDKAIDDISKREIDFGLYNYKYEGISLYSLIRLEIRKLILRQWGVPSLDLRNSGNDLKLLFSCAQSLFSFLSFYLKRAQCPTLFISSPRVDIVGDFYMDKFTDPLIECADMDSDYVIFEVGRRGEHKRPRYHSNKVINCDILPCLYFSYGRFKSVFKSRNIESVIRDLEKAISSAFPDINFDIDSIRTKIYSKLCSIRLYERIFKKKGIKYIFSTVRPYDIFIAGNKLGLKTFELQHGVSFEGTELYSGFRDELILPTCFLAFGENEPKSVYGISESRMINIGFAFHTFLNKQEYERGLYDTKDVLVVSDPEITDVMVSAISYLAKENEEYVFHYRCHPHEHLSVEQVKTLSDAGVRVQDNKINISIVLNQFSNIVGENSTVLYEAVSCGKKAAKLFYDGLNPEYLSPADKDCFWEIHSQEDFLSFMNAPATQKNNKSIYSDFDVQLFKNLFQ